MVYCPVMTVERARKRLSRRKLLFLTGSAGISLPLAWILRRRGEKTPDMPVVPTVLTTPEPLSEELQTRLAEVQLYSGLYLRRESDTFWSSFDTFTGREVQRMRLKRNLMPLKRTVVMYMI